MYKKPLKKYLLIPFFTIVILVLIWFLFTIPRITKYREYLVTVKNQKFENLLSVSDRIPKVSKMPNFKNIDWQKFECNLDSNGIKLTNYDETHIRGVGGIQRYPYNIAGFASNKLLQYLKNGNKNDLLISLRQFDYLVYVFQNKKINDTEVGFWNVPFNLGYQYNVKAPWSSALSQAACLEAMVYAYQITDNQYYLNIFERGLNAFKFSTKIGGLSFITQKGGLFFEEVVTPPPLHHILNGHMDALIKIYKCALFINSPNAMKLFNLGVIGLKDMLPMFDAYGYSLYSLSTNPSLENHFNIASPYYHNLHIAQLKILGEITGEKTFFDYAKKWENQTGGIKEFMWIQIYFFYKDLVINLKNIGKTF